MLRENLLFPTKGAQSQEKDFIPVFSEPKAAPYRVIAKSVLSSEMDVSWEPVEQGEVTGVLLGYEVGDSNGNGRP